MTNKYVHETVELGRQTLIEGLDLVKENVKYGWFDDSISVLEDAKLTSYDRLTLETETTGIEELSLLASALKGLDKKASYLGRTAGEVEEVLRDWAQDTAEQAELPFTYVDGEGHTQTYTPASLWEASGSCSEWEESAQEGYDYGWNI